MNWIDIAIIIIMVVFVGTWKGFVFSVLSIFSSTINFFISLLLTRPTTNLLNRWFGFEGSLTNGLSSKLTSMSAKFDVNMVGMSKDEISSHISTTLSESKFPLKGLFGNMLKVTPEKIEGKTSCTLNDILSRSLGSFFSLIITFVVLFILIYIILFIIGKISKKAQEVNGIRAVDRTLGFIFGFVKGALIICFVFAILSFFSEDGFLSGLFEYIHASKIGDWVYTTVNNIIDKYVNFKTIAEETYKHLHP